ncbi:hypothetical protein PQJ75_06155 [Rhodoplanes sp. TEM]|uniref:DUF2946 domain-containing protein n=1 Tax=Rhodoplanes tepidamans TaxID=200616 RepID=A0ABT5J7Q3_RHOTP|nr:MULTISPECIES: DUF2946 family protein [Rhodoplanes]MDC7785668.1 hypothetical protein [Rhodoplanes tepidamans]MDC7983309.1 hypothetical protein [Rhodoplanes sp. TEM]MDQ0354765.1 hypothetical protein [Rhodoplanes tepidamans]
MFRALRQQRFSRVVGLVAAYALALQMLLAGIVATQMAVSGDSALATLCFGTGDTPDGSGTTPAPATHSPCAICAFTSATPPLPATAGLALPQACRRIRRRARTTPRRRARRRDPRSSRGPPPAV